MGSSVRNIQRLNERELELALTGSGSWHDQYKDSAYIFVGGLPFDLTEGDVITIFSQYGEVVDIHMPRARDEPSDERGAQGERRSKEGASGKHRGFGFLMYEDQRSTVLAVDNLNGAQVLGRTLRVDHTYYRHRGTKDEHGNWVEPEEQTFNCAPPEIVVDDEPEEDVDLEDPMAGYFAERRREERKRERRREGRESRHRHRGDRHERHREELRGGHRDEQPRDRDHDERHRRHRRHRDDHERREDRHRHGHDHERREDRHRHGRDRDGRDRHRDRSPHRSSRHHEYTPEARDARHGARYQDETPPAHRASPSRRTPSPEPRPDTTPRMRRSSPDPTP